MAVVDFWWRIEIGSFHSILRRVYAASGEDAAVFTRLVINYAKSISCSNAAIEEPLSDIGGWDTESVSQALHSCDDSDVFDLAFFIVILSTCELNSKHVGSLDGIPSPRPSFANELIGTLNCGVKISDLLSSWRPPSTSSGASLYGNTALISEISWEGNFPDYLVGLFDGKGLLNVRSG